MTPHTITVPSRPHTSPKPSPLFTDPFYAPIRLLFKFLIFLLLVWVAYVFSALFGGMLTREGYREAGDDDGDVDVEEGLVNGEAPPPYEACEGGGRVPAYVDVVEGGEV
ncbi:hypothetical protein BU23DRAFT_116916 [Bimuria novae-zelandiae CBS 107.79]|uniref:Uncharacterized protein n=1 Tax=Bimuria novae-zelandiae CBS 107.79 TaxID=1447943 RepID=A0A6A5VC64_9PLEO|nr:hypothetical protein BU23DRAFT_116916 [Bimuria novae-zelandiae CBS 107.79]